MTLFFNPFYQWTTEINLFLLEDMILWNMGAAGPGRYILASLLSVQLKLIWREVKDRQHMSASKSPLNLWLFEICVAKALCETHRDSWSQAIASSVCRAGGGGGGGLGKEGPERERERGVGMWRGGGSCQGFTLRVLSVGKNKPENLGCLQVLKHF